MPLSSQQRQELEKHKKQYTDEATRLLLQKNDTEGAEQAFKKAKLSEDILARNNSTSPRRLYLSLIFALLCVVLVSFAWDRRLPNPRIHLDVDAETAVLRLAKSFHWQGEPGLETDTIQVEGLVKIEAPGLGLTGITERLDAGGKGVTLKWIKANAGARLEVERGGDYIALYLYDGVLQGQVELQDAELRLVIKGRSESRTISDSVPETLNFITSAKGSPRVRLRLQTSKDWRLDGLHVSGMVFERESPPGTGNRVSSILKGTIELPEIKRKETLLENDWLRLSEANSTRLHLTFAAADKNCFNLFFQGRARSLSAGPEGFEQNLAPSLLTYLYHQKQLTFFWSALVFVYGLLWSLRNILKSG